LSDKNDSKDKFVWLIKLDDKGITQWFDIEGKEEIGLK